MGYRVHIATLGCRVNEAETGTWERQFGARGHRVVEAPEQADVIVLNSCAVTAEAAKKSRQLVRRVHRDHPTARLVLTGCYASLEAEAAAALAGVDLVVANADKERLVALVEAHLPAGVMPSLAQEADEEAAFPYRRSRTRAFVKVQDGCRNQCAFCIVTVARGEERSRSIEEVVQEVRQRQDEGYEELVLTGIHIGGYGHDHGTTLASLLEAVLARTTIPRVRVGSLEPWDLPPGFFGLWQDGRLCPHLHLPLQSGSDTVLRRMARRCTTERFEGLVAEARAAIPALHVSTDLIVGFPGESDVEAQETLELVERIGFGQLHVFAFSARAGTRAARMGSRVAPEVIRARAQELVGLGERMRRAFLERQVGARRQVLWEGTGSPSSDGALLWTGYTENYLRAIVHAPAEEGLRGTVWPVEVTGVDGGALLVERTPTS